MRIAVGLISIFLGLLVLVQSCAVATTAGLAQDAATGDAGAVGIVVGLLFFTGGAFSFGLPMVATVVLLLAGLLALLGGGAFGDLRIWAYVAFGLAGLSLIAWRSARKRAAAFQTPPAAS
ncbi:hypothetical protein [Aureimonas jatrophae]|uniref:Lipoprotein n=1 Tax=Aureimonas jatrophae TaxID=1166073 RepID=A0A1H0NJ37_9HYPH|nr:hypothetical protein [Aureimonas jatrophae]MBB3953070.1 hypothetical protein [Aureimonas jatrophae]SDO92360.1 hypothetical protein SAMN05192530_12211 [Aureimonas jatrophae]